MIRTQDRIAVRTNILFFQTFIPLVSKYLIFLFPDNYSVFLPETLPLGGFCEFIKANVVDRNEGL